MDRDNLSEYPTSVSLTPGAPAASNTSCKKTVLLAVERWCLVCMDRVSNVRKYLSLITGSLVGILVQQYFSRVGPTVRVYTTFYVVCIMCSGFSCACVLVHCPWGWDVGGGNVRRRVRLLPRSHWAKLNLCVSEYYFQCSGQVWRYIMLCSYTCECDKNDDDVINIPTENGNYLLCI